MDVAPGAERLSAARAEIGRACDLLIASTPEALENGRRALENAVSVLREFRSSQVAMAGPGLRALALALRTDLARARRLCENLAAFYRGWERILGTMSGGYTVDGSPAAVARRGRIYCRG